MNEPGSAIKRTLLSRSAAIFSIRFFPLAAMAVAGLFYARILPREAYGAYQLVWVYLAVFVAFAAAGIPPLMLTHTPGTVDAWLRQHQPRHARAFGLWLLALSAILFGVMSYLQGLARWAAPLLFLVQVWVLLLETYLIIHKRFAVAIAGSAFYSGLFLLFHYLALRSAFSLTTLFWLLTLLGAVRVLLLASAARRQYCRQRQDSEEPMSAAIRKQWVQLGIYDVSQVAFRWVDKIIISLFVPTAIYAIYQSGTQDVPFMATLLSAVGNGILQQMAAGEKTRESRLTLIHTSGALLGRVVFPIFFFLFLFREELFTFALTTKYQESVPLFAISIMALPLRAYNYTSVLQHLNQVRLINWGALMDICLALALAYPLYLTFNLKGVAFAFMISSYVQAGFYLYHTARLMGCSILQLIPWKQWGIMLIAFGTVLIGLRELLNRYFSPREALFLGAAATCLIIAAVLAPVFFSRKTNG